MKKYFELIETVKNTKYTGKTEIHHVNYIYDPRVETRDSSYQAETVVCSLADHCRLHFLALEYFVKNGLMKYTNACVRILGRCKHANVLETDELNKFTRMLKKHHYYNCKNDFKDGHGHSIYSWMQYLKIV